MGATLAFRGPPAVLTCPLMLYLLVLGLAAGCDTFEYEGWLGRPVPIAFLDSIPTLPLALAGQPAVIAAIDTGSPRTIVHDKSSTFELGASGALADYRLLTDLAVSRSEVWLYDATRPSVARYIFRDVDVLDLPVGQRGIDAPVKLGAIVGADILAHYAVRLSYETAQLTLRDALPDTWDELAGDCDALRLLETGGYAEQRCLAVFSTPLRGGGTLRLGGDEVSLGPGRLTLPLCLVPDEFDPVPRTLPRSRTGIGATALLVTGLGTSLLSRSTYERVKAVFPAVRELGERMIYLAGGPETGLLVELPRMALVEDRTTELGPCEELHRRRRLLAASAGVITVPEADQSGASVALLQGNIEFAVIDDRSSIWAGLRHELRPLVPDVEVLLGSSVLSAFDLDLDYPNSRSILRCRPNTTDEACRITPRCNATDAPPYCIPPR